MLPAFERRPADIGVALFCDAATQLMGTDACLNLCSIWARDAGGEWLHIFTYGRMESRRSESGGGAEYLTVREIRWSVAANETREFLRRALKDGLHIPGMGEPVKFRDEVSVDYRPRRQPDQARYAEWPEGTLASPVATQIDLPRAFFGPVARLGDDAYIDGRDYLRARTGCARWSMNFDWARGVCIEFEDRRGRVAAVGATDWLAGEVYVDVESADSRIEEVRVVFESGGVVTRDCMSRQPESDRWTVRVPNATAGMTVMLLAADGGVADVVGPLSVANLLLERPAQLTPAAMRELVDRGESDSVEFKSWTIFAKFKEAKSAVLKAVVAFANAAGGDLLVGISNRGAADGPVADCTGAGAVKVDVEVEATAREVRGWIVEECLPSVVNSVELAVLDSRVVLRVKIDAGTDLPVMLRSGELYIRRGAHSVRPDRRELLTLCR